MSSELKCNCFDTTYWKDNRFGRCPRCDYVEPPPIPRSSLPALPDEVIPPFVVKRSTPTNQWFVCGREDEIVAETSYEKYATFLAALLNAVYGGGENKS